VIYHCGIGAAQPIISLPVPAVGLLPLILALPVD